MNRGQRLGVALLVSLGAFIFLLLTVGSLGEPQPDVERIAVAAVLDGGPPAARYGDDELHISGWYAELEADCQPDVDEPADPIWLERTCPMRVLMPYQPSASVSQEELSAHGLRLAAPIGQPFPARARPEGPNLRLQQLVYVGHFDDPATSDCAPQLADQCRNTFVVSDYDGLLR